MNATKVLLPVTISLVLAFHTCVAGASGVDSLFWSQVSAGVNYASADSALGNDVFIGLGGWTVQQAWANNWALHLYSARLHGIGIRHLYAVAGPRDDDYFSRELGTLDLARHLLVLFKSNPAPKRVIVVAHSSGAYVAHALFQDLYDGASIDSTHLTDGKILYFSLDGGIGAGGSGVEITQTMANRLGHIYGVFALMPVPNLYSPNHAEMVELGAKFCSRSSSLLVDATGCGCTGKWCVHETLINQKPYNQTTFNLKDDYGSINADHPVTTAYLDGITGLGRSLPQPEGFRLEQNYPNPFNPSTKIGFRVWGPGSGVTSIDNWLGSAGRVGASSWVRLAVYDILGREVELLVDERKAAGNYEVRFNASELTSGVYFYRLQTENFTQTRSLMVLK